MDNATPPAWQVHIFLSNLSMHVLKIKATGDCYTTSGEWRQTKKSKNNPPCMHLTSFSPLCKHLPSLTQLVGTELRANSKGLVQQISPLHCPKKDPNRSSLAVIFLSPNCPPHLWRCTFVFNNGLFCFHNKNVSFCTVLFCLLIFLSPCLKLEHCTQESRPSYPLPTAHC
jgi:hypothetical protein